MVLKERCYFSYIPTSFIMARPKGTILYTGTIDGKTIYHDKLNGLVMRRPGGPSKEQIKKSKTCEPVRQNNSEFKRANEAASVLTKAFTLLKERSGDMLLNRRLKSVLQYTIKKDNLHAPGSRILHNGNVSQMGPVELNGKTAFDNIVEWDIKHGYNGNGFVITLSCRLRKFLKEATHYQLSCQLVHLELSSYPGTFSSDLQETEFIAVKGESDLLQRQFMHPYNNTELVRMHGLAIAFYRYTNGEYYLLNNMNFNAGVINGLI